MVVTKELRDVAAMGLRDTRYDVGPLIALVDGPDFDFIWNERRHLVQGQIDDADIVVISRADLIAKEEQDAIIRTLTPRGNPYYPFSVQRHSDVEYIFSMIDKFETNGKRQQTNTQQ
jgi:G3E family GTPase